MPLFEPKDLARLSPVFKGRLGEGLARFLMHFLSVDDFIEVYDSQADKEGPDFAEGILQYTGAEYQVGNAERLGNLPDGPFITISNHPYGGMDGVVLVDLFGHIREDYKVLVNKILATLKALDPSFITVTPTGEKRTAPTADSINGIKNALRHLRDGHPLGIFPSGAVSDLSLKDGCIRDREWQEAMIKFIVKAGVPVVPVRFFDGNSLTYYLLGLISWKVRLLRLPLETISKRGKRIRVGIGETITPEMLAKADNPAKMLRDSVYGMPLPDKFIKRSGIWK